MMFKALWSASCACGRPRQCARRFYLVSTSWQQSTSGGDAGAGETGNQLLQDDSSGQHRLQECNSKPVFQQCPAQDSSSTADTPLDKLDALLVQLKADKQTIIFAKQHLIASTSCTDVSVICGGVDILVSRQTHVSRCHEIFQ